jgi:hypothetical protein
MAIVIASTAERAERNIANIELKLNQNTPANDKAFNRVLSTNQAAYQTETLRYALDQALQNLILTSSGERLDEYGEQYGVPRNPATATILEANLPAVDGTMVTTLNDFFGDLNNVQYLPDGTYTASGGLGIDMQLTAQELGATGNLSIGATLSIGSSLAGAENTATVTSVVQTGADEESDDIYRQRLLDAVRVTPGGGNAADYRLWAQDVSGVARAYPYAGLPVTDPGFLNSEPPERTVYVESTTDIDPDGIPPQSLLDDVRDRITTDPDTGEANQPLGLTDDTLYVEPIIRTGFYVTVVNLLVDPLLESQLKIDIESALSDYFLSVAPFVDGLDAEIDRNDTITDPSVSEIVNSVVRNVGGSIDGVSFGLTPGSSLGSFTLQQGEKSKLLGVSYI